MSLQDLERDDYGMLIACLKQDEAGALTDWIDRHVGDSELRAFALVLASVTSTYTRMILGIPDDGECAQPDAAVFESRNHEDAHRLVVMHLNRDTYGAAGLLEGVEVRGDLGDVCFELIGLARGALYGMVGGGPRG